MARGFSLSGLEKDSPCGPIHAIFGTRMALTSPNHRLTEAQYLEIERTAEFKSEFFDGEMFAMAGGSRRHSLIASNLIGELRTRLKGRPCVVFNSDLRVKVEATGLFAPQRSEGQS